MRVLIVEDDPILQDSLARAMRAAGYATDLAADGEAALALLRRGQGGSPHLTCGALDYDSVGRRASVAGEALELSQREVSVLESLLFRQGKVVSKDQLIESLCGYGEEVSANAIEVYMHRLRRKLEPAGVTIRTLRGLGYLMDKI